MAEIEQFTLKRQDGKTVTEQMGLADIERLGWPASPIVAAAWQHAGRAITFNVAPGSLAQVIAGHRYVAVMVEQDGKTPSRLLVVGSDGTVTREIPRRQVVNGKTVDVDFAWFEKPRLAGEDRFGVVVYLSRGVTYQLDIDASSGTVVAAQEAR